MTAAVIKEAPADVYRLLAECFYPPGEVIERLRDLPAGENPFLDRLAEAARNSGSMTDLAVDYAKLFVGPYKLLAPPYGSIYLGENGLMGRTTLDAAELYRSEGLETAIKEAPDHIAVELEFAHFLRQKELEAVDGGDLESAELYCEKRADFLRRHLCAWIEEFAGKVRENSRTEFYPVLADMAVELTIDDLRHLACEND